jgi:hypothetical protein
MHYVGARLFSMVIRLICIKKFKTRKPACTVVGLVLDHGFSSAYGSTPVPGIFSRRHH